MKNSLNKAWMPAVLAFAAATTLTPCRVVALTVGDPAPKLQVGKWVQGEPVKDFARDKVYIVEFWATWCGPCRATIPHVNELQNKLKDKGLVVIGQDCWEQDEAKVAPFVKEMGEKMTYRVATDDKTSSDKGKMAETWMEAAGQNGIPCAFVVDKQGTIAWIGHPATLKEDLLEQVIAGKFDVKQAAADFEKANKNKKLVNDASQKFQRAMKDKQWAEADASLTELEKLLTGTPRSAFATSRLSILIGKGDTEAAYKLAGELSDAEPKNAMLQNQLAWTLLTAKELKNPDLGLAEKIATRANDAADGKDPAILDTLARACFMNGKKDKAVELQEKATTLADEGSRAQYRKTLNSYKEGNLPEVNE